MNTIIKKLIEFSNIFLNHYINNKMLIKIDYIYYFFENLKEDFFK